MTEFKQWHDEKNSFNRQVKLYFGQCDEHKNISLSELLLFTSDTAVEDYFVRGLSFEFLKENNIGILVSRASFRFHSIPKSNELITLKTWEEKPRGLQLSRNYEITNSETGKLLVSGVSTWLVVNLENRRIMKPADFTLRPEPDFTTEMDCLDCGKISPKENPTKLDERPIRFSDIDANGHMNNSRYGAFIMDSLPQEYQNKTFTDFRINYSHEATKDDVLSIYGSFDDEAKKIIISGKKENDVCFESEFYYL